MGYNIKTLLREKLNEIASEIFSAYHGRYKFDVTKLYQLIKTNKIKYVIKKYPPNILKFLSHQEFSYVDQNKIEKIRQEMDYSKPIGLMVNFMNPETEETEWILVDGNHRVRIAAEDKQPAILYAVPDPIDVAKVMKTNQKIPHELFAIYERLKKKVKKNLTM